jgi:hypothetical protein
MATSPAFWLLSTNDFNDERRPPHTAVFQMAQTFLQHPTRHALLKYISAQEPVNVRNVQASGAETEGERDPYTPCPIDGDSYECILNARWR